jgi:hypothetical protein
MLIAPGIIAHIVSSVFGLLVSWVGHGAATVVTEVGKAMATTTSPILNAGFLTEYKAMGAIGAVMCLPIVIFAVIQAIVHQDLGTLVRVILIRLPASILLAAAAVSIVQLGLSATDGFCNYLLQATQSQTDSVFGVVTTLLLGISGVGKPLLPFTGFAALLFAILAAILAILLWLELALRSAAVAITTLFLPLALAGSTWSATSHWAKRLGETIFALIISKLVIVAILDLATVTLASVGSDGISAGVTGMAILFLAALAPYVVLKLIPMFEQGALSHLEGVARRPLHLMDTQSFTRRMAIEGSDFFNRWGGGNGDNDDPADFVGGGVPGGGSDGGGVSFYPTGTKSVVSTPEVKDTQYEVGENNVFRGQKITPEQQLLSEKMYNDLLRHGNLHNFDVTTEVAKLSESTLLPTETKVVNSGDEARFKEHNDVDSK